MTHSQLRRIVLLALTLLPICSGCALFPEVSHQSVIRNPFPQLSKIAVVDFVNQSDDATVNGREVAEMYVNELQQLQGYEVLPVSVVMNAVQDLQINLANPHERRRLAAALQVDAVVVGSVTEFTAYYPPRCGLSVNWYAANPGYHPIPPGYGLPWGTAEEEFIPDSLVYEAEFALAREQMETQTPEIQPPGRPQQMPPQRMPQQLPPGEQLPAPLPMPPGGGREDAQGENNAGDEEGFSGDPSESLSPPSDIEQMSGAEMIGPDGNIVPGMSGVPDAAMLPPNWPDPRGFIPAGPQPTRPSSRPTNAPVMRHTRIYHGNDADFTTALATYVGFRDEARFGGWQGYLQRSDDFLRFCCHKHISEMISARGGADKSRVVYRWRDDR